MSYRHPDRPYQPYRPHWAARIAGFLIPITLGAVGFATLLFFAAAEVMYTEEAFHQVLLIGGGLGGLFGAVAAWKADRGEICGDHDGEVFVRGGEWFPD